MVSTISSGVTYYGTLLSYFLNFNKAWLTLRGFYGVSLEVFLLSSSYHFTGVLQVCSTSYVIRYHRQRITLEGFFKLNLCTYFCGVLSAVLVPGTPGTPLEHPWNTPGTVCVTLLELYYHIRRTVLRYSTVQQQTGSHSSVYGTVHQCTHILCKSLRISDSASWKNGTSFFAVPL